MCIGTLGLSLWRGGGLCGWGCGLWCCLLGCCRTGKPLGFGCLFVYWVRRVAVWRVNLAFTTRHRLQAGLFRALIDLVVNTKLHIIRRMPQVVVVTHNAIRVDDHPRRQEQNTPSHR